MAKINFTKEHKEKLDALVLKFIFGQKTIQTSLGQTVNVYDLLHTQTIKTLEAMRTSLKKSIENMESADEWSVTDTEQAKLTALRERYDLINLIIGYKRYNIQKVEHEKLLAEKRTALEKLKEAQKTPDERMRELEEEIKAMGEF